MVCQSRRVYFAIVSVLQEHGYNLSIMQMTSTFPKVKKTSKALQAYTSCTDVRTGELGLIVYITSSLLCDLTLEVH